ncbi:acetyltransferase [Nocardioides sp. T2.26MG-1]|uniref:acetyltransferase n=1 Tax=Nocardioides sp. T2.26MG-1 TaxID=3041166 RepID=UPI0024775032|nr:acetyltransferase [Nocardioides sp. T2.26MG-1]CAI9398706.1 Putative acetyltransferase EpsM [Nocardioides sp. T2.26MG-1]
MNDLLILGAGGLAREVLAFAASSFERVRVLDDDESRWGTTLAGHSVIGGLDLAVERRGDALVVCLGRGSARRSVVERLLAQGVDPERFVTLLHPSVTVPASCTVGAGSVVLAGCVLTADVRVARHVVVMPNVTLTHDDRLDDYVTVCAGVSLGGDVHIGRAAYLGMNASVRPDRTVGAGAVLGMGAVLIDHLPPGETWVGVPARPAARPVRHAS